MLTVYAMLIMLCKNYAKNHPYFSLNAAKFLADLIDEKYGGRVDAGEVPEETMKVLGFYGLYHEKERTTVYTREDTIKILRELHKQYGDDMPVSLLPKEVLQALIEYGYVEPIYKEKNPRDPRTSGGP